MTTVETQRLILRPFEPGDVAAYATIRAKSHVVRFLPGGPERAQQAREVAERLVPEWARAWREGVGYGPWAAIDRASGRLLGHLGLRHLPELEGATEILYMLDDRAWGKGIATEGATAARDFAFARLALPRVMAMALPGNIGSVRVMEHIGLRYDGMVEAFGVTGIRFAMTRGEWEQGPAAASSGATAATLAALDHIQIAIPAGSEDLSRAFYIGLLGMAEVAKPKPLQARGGLWLRSGPISLHLGVEADFRPARKAHPAFRVRDLDSLATRLAAAGREVIWDDTPPGTRRFFTSDPVGNRIELIGPRAALLPRH
jgi:RimJ/RimL family protein N-acetyltransferase/catechol 2,3-dioxygenase-like lactoylglutathione lyase family enzyme